MKDKPETAIPPQRFNIEVTRAEFLKLPMPLRRKTLKKQTQQMLLIGQWEKKWMAAVETTNSLSTKSLVAQEALDALATALAGHNHQWTPHERAIYECATGGCPGCAGTEHEHSRYCVASAPLNC